MPKFVHKIHDRTYKTVRRDFGEICIAYLRTCRSQLSLIEFPISTRWSVKRFEKLFIHQKDVPTFVIHLTGSVHLNRGKSDAGQPPRILKNVKVPWSVAVQRSVRSEI